jgi:hypothetical protein
VTALAEVIDLAAIRAGGPHVRSITRAEVDERVSAIREALAFSLRGLAELREADAHVVAFGSEVSWHEACERWFGDLRSLRLSGSPEAVAEREALVRSIRATGASTRTIRDRLGVSSYAVSEALREVDPAPERIEGADGRTRSSRTGRQQPAEVLPAPVGRVWQVAAEYLRRNPAGLTLVELARVAGWTEGKASGALSDLVRVRGLAVRTEDRRDGQRVHVHAIAGEVTE